MVHQNPYDGFLRRIRQNNELLDDLKQRNQSGEKLKPEQIKGAYNQAHGTVTDLAGFLGIDNAGTEDEAVDQAGLDAYDQAVETCMNVTKLSLDLARLHGTAYLIIPD